MSSGAFVLDRSTGGSLGCSPHILRSCLGFVAESFCRSLHRLKSFRSRRSSGCGGVDVREVFLSLRHVLAARAFEVISSASVGYIDIDEVLAVSAGHAPSPRHPVLARAYNENGLLI